MLLMETSQFKSSLKNIKHRLIDNFLGPGSPQAQYNYSDFLLALRSTFYSGGSCIEDEHTHLKPYLSD